MNLTLKSQRIDKIVNLVHYMLQCQCLSVFHDFNNATKYAILRSKIEKNENKKMKNLGDT